jgi:hypothetical protein
LGDLHPYAPSGPLEYGQKIASSFVLHPFNVFVYLYLVIFFTPFQFIYFIYFGVYLYLVVWTYLMNWTFIDILAIKSRMKKILMKQNDI